MTHFLVEKRDGVIFWPSPIRHTSPRSRSPSTSDRILSFSFLSLCVSAGVRVLHSLSGESGVPAQHCQKVYRPEICLTGESQTANPLKPDGSCALLSLVNVFVSRLCQAAGTVRQRGPAGERLPEDSLTQNLRQIPGAEGFYTKTDK